MINFSNILDNLISQAIIVALSSILSIFVPKILNKNNKNYFLPLNISIFFSIMSIGNLILNLSFWQNQKLTMFLTLSSCAFFYLTYYIYKNECPNCHKFIHAKKRVKRDTKKEWKEKVKIQRYKIWLYSNGEEWKRKKLGKQINWVEKWKRINDTYKCSFCKHIWSSGEKDICTNENLKPKNDVEKTDKKDPTGTF